MKKFFFLACILQKFLFSTVNEPLSLEIGTSYREDKFNWKISSDSEENLLIYEEKYRCPRYLQTNVSLRAIERDFYFFANFAYSFFATSTMHQKDRDEMLYAFDFKNHGYDLESALEMGLAVNLTPERIEKIILIPLVGYNAFWKIYKRIKANPLEINGVSSSLNKRLKQIWFGPYLGVNLEIMPSEKVIFDLGYHFNWLQLKHKSYSDLIENDEDNYKIIDSKLNAHAHQAMGKIAYVFNKNCQFAICGRYNYFLSKDKTNVSFTNGETLVYKNNFFSRWSFGVIGLMLIFQY